MRSLAQIDAQREVQRPARAEKQRRRLRLQARPVRGDQHIRRQRLGLGPGERGEAGRAGLFRHLDQQGGVEAKRAPGADHRLEGRDVDQVLALVVGGATAIKPVAFGRQPEGVAPRTPSPRHARHHVAMAVVQHRGQACILDPPGDHQRAAARIGVGVDPAVKAECAQPGLQQLREIALQRSRVGGFAGAGDQRGKIAGEPFGGIGSDPVKGGVEGGGHGRAFRILCGQSGMAPPCGHEKTAPKRGSVSGPGQGA